TASWARPRATPATSWWASRASTPRSRASAARPAASTARATEVRAMRSRLSEESGLAERILVGIVAWAFDSVACLVTILMTADHTTTDSHGTVLSINSLANSINGTVHDINANAGSINATVHTINDSIGNVLNLVYSIRGDKNVSGLGNGLAGSNRRLDVLLGQ